MCSLCSCFWSIQELLLKHTSSCTSSVPWALICAVGTSNVPWGKVWAPQPGSKEALEPSGVNGGLSWEQFIAHLCSQGCDVLKVRGQINNLNYWKKIPRVGMGIKSAGGSGLPIPVPPAPLGLRKPWRFSRWHGGWFCWSRFLTWQDNTDSQEMCRENCIMEEFLLGAILQQTKWKKWHLLHPGSLVFSLTPLSSHPSSLSFFLFFQGTDICAGE